MEIRLKIKLVVLWKTIILLGIIVLLSACFHSKKEAVSSIAIILMSIRYWRLRRNSL